MKSNTIQFRILSEAVDKIYPTPRFQYGDFVAYRSSKKGWIIGEVTKLVWHEKDQEFKYYLSINEKEEKRWLDPDRIEPFNLNEFSKTISHALRHVPEEYHLTLLDGDWVLHSDLIDELSKKKPEWENINLSVIKVMIDRSEKKRHEIDGEFISAKYGHTAHVELSLPNSSPPEILYHGTSRKSAKIILKEGLKSMDRHYVHSSHLLEEAIRVGKRKDEKPTILKIDAQSASKAGIKFYIGNDKIWLSDEISANYIQEHDENS